MWRKRNNIPECVDFHLFKSAVREVCKEGIEHVGENDTALGMSNDYAFRDSLVHKLFFEVLIHLYFDHRVSTRSTRQSLKHMGLNLPRAHPQ